MFDNETKATQRVETAVVAGTAENTEMSVEKKMTYALDKINRNLFREGKTIDDSYITWEHYYCTATKIERESLPPKKLPAIYVKLTWGLNIDNQTTDCHLSQALSPFAKKVYLAVNWLWEQGFRVITVYQIYKVLGNKGNPRPEETRKIWDTLNDLRQTVAVVTNEKEVAQHKHAKKIRIKDAQLLYFERTSDNSLTEFSLYIPAQPFLIKEAKNRGQVRSIDLRLLNPPIKESNRVSELNFYLIDAVLNSQNPIMSDKLKWSTMYKDLKIEDRGNKFRTRKDVKTLLAYYKFVGFVADFTLESDGMIFQHHKIEE